MSEDNERELIDRAQAGEAIAFERLAEQHAARLWRCALALGKDGHWAEDLAQETLVEAWRCLARFDGRCKFSTWLYGIAMLFQGGGGAAFAFADFAAPFLEAKTVKYKMTAEMKGP